MQKWTTCIWLPVAIHLGGENEKMSMDKKCVLEPGMTNEIWKSVFLVCGPWVFEGPQTCHYWPCLPQVRGKASGRLDVHFSLWHHLFLSPSHLLHHLMRPSDVVPMINVTKPVATMEVASSVEYHSSGQFFVWLFRYSCCHISIASIWDRTFVCFPRAPLLWTICRVVSRMLECNFKPSHCLPTKVLKLTDCFVSW